MPVVDGLLSLKMSSPEIGETPQITVLNDFIELNLGLIRRQIEALPAVPQSSWDTLNHLFLTLLKG